MWNDHIAGVSLLVLPLLLGYLADLLLGDPEKWPHVVRLFGNAIAMCEKRLNRGRMRFVKGGAMATSI